MKNMKVKTNYDDESESELRGKWKSAMMRKVSKWAEVSVDNQTKKVKVEVSDKEGENQQWWRKWNFKLTDWEKWKVKVKIYRLRNMKKWKLKLIDRETWKSESVN